MSNYTNLEEDNNINNNIDNNGNNESNDINNIEGATTTCEIDIEKNLLNNYNNFNENIKINELNKNRNFGEYIYHYNGSDVGNSIMFLSLGFFLYFPFFLNLVYINSIFPRARRISIASFLIGCIYSVILFFVVLGTFSNVIYIFNQNENLRYGYQQSNNQALEILDRLNDFYSCNI